MLLYECLYQDDAILVVNKAPTLPCHPLKDMNGLSLIEAVARDFPEVQMSEDAPLEGGLCHRLDNGTSGIVVIARTPEAKKEWRARFTKGSIEKSYLALVKGKVEKSAAIDFAIAHHAKNKRKMVALKSASMHHRSQPQSAHTEFTVLFANQEASLLRVRIGAGRRHQIRVHMAAVGHPLIGDLLYGGPPAHALMGHGLHAATLILPSGQRLEAPCPKEWETELSFRGLLLP